MKCGTVCTELLFEIPSPRRLPQGIHDVIEFVCDWTASLRSSQTMTLIGRRISNEKRLLSTAIDYNDQLHPPPPPPPPPPPLHLHSNEAPLYMQINIRVSDIPSFQERKQWGGGGGGGGGGRGNRFQESAGNHCP